jgi:excisionase family DNA binding protein
VSATPASLGLVLPDSLVEHIAERAAEILRASATAPHDSAWPEWMSVPTAARYLDVSEERVRKLKDRGAIRCHQEAPGCRVFFRRSDLDEAMAALRIS